jgi:hypothetical protein
VVFGDLVLLEGQDLAADVFADGHAWFSSQWGGVGVLYMRILVGFSRC